MMKKQNEILKVADRLLCGAWGYTVYRSGNNILLYIMSSSYGEFEARVSCVRDDEFHEIDDEYQESPSVNDDELQESSSVSNDESHESSESDVGSDNESDGGYPAIYDSNESSESGVPCRGQPL
jgi:hypothetical protein